MICYSGGVCSAKILSDVVAAPMGTHCDMKDYTASSDKQSSQISIQNSESVDTKSSNCCYETLTSSSSIKDNANYINLEVMYVLELPTSIFYKDSRYTDHTFAGCTHDPPDICLSVSRFLL